VGGRKQASFKQSRAAPFVAILSLCHVVWQFRLVEVPKVDFGVETQPFLNVNAWKRAASKGGVERRIQKKQIHAQCAVFAVPHQPMM
jgi:hypothetical protein